MIEKSPQIGKRHNSFQESFISSPPHQKSEFILLSYGGTNRAYIGRWDIFFLKILLIYLRERERAHKWWGEGQRKRETDSLLSRES